MSRYIDPCYYYQVTSYNIIAFPLQLPYHYYKEGWGFLEGSIGDGCMLTSLFSV